MNRTQSQSNDGIGEGYAGKESTEADPAAVRHVLVKHLQRPGLHRQPDGLLIKD